MKIKKKDIDMLAKTLKEHDVDYIEYSDENFSFKLGYQATTGSPFLNQNETSFNNSPKEVSENGVNEVNTSEDLGTPVYTPIVGNFFTTKKPGEPDFVKVGQKVNEGEVIAIVEAMKVMNEIKSPASGTITSIEIKSGEFVDANSIIMYIK